jgi:hypothetical protein
MNRGPKGTPAMTEDNEDEPRGCFQVLAERKYNLSAKGYYNFRGAFDSLKEAKAFAQKLAKDDSFYTGYAWVQVADVFHGKVWDYEDGDWTQYVP